jgi:hypothetical protein
MRRLKYLKNFRNLDIGFNEKLVQVIESNGGSVYNEDDVQGLLFMDIKERLI